MFPEASFRLLTEGSIEEFTEAHRKQGDYLKTAEHKPIGLPYDGESFNDKTLSDFLDRLFMLRDAGYNIPEYVFEDVKSEILAEGNT